MSIAAPSDRVQPELTTVAVYTLHRLNDLPGFHVHFAETVRSFEQAVVDAASESVPGAGFDTVSVSTWANRTDLIGRELFDENKVLLATVTDAVTTTEQVDEEGNVVAPAYVTLTLDTPLDADPTGTIVMLHRKNPFGMPVHEVARGGRMWEIVLEAGTAECNARMEQMLGTVMFSALKNGFEEAGVTKTDAEIWAIVQALAAKGVNIETLISRECEALELERRQGLLDFARVYGEAPYV